MLLEEVYEVYKLLITSKQWTTGTCKYLFHTHV